ncbi:PREDICTED: tail-anchored protein insertion receptor WRB-like [Polistes dominula]|uniref:Guided entry of tail-anchored proteins factor 1 n=1 Tax=Polistes dominula TaxID=743375 RepID=A0ABM1IY83_POLDO|nr:PREDICTED: tail-anchored protein insertion receptor WRB-like [Polistes dominula]
MRGVRPTGTTDEVKAVLSSAVRSWPFFFFFFFSHQVPNLIITTIKTAVRREIDLFVQKLYTDRGGGGGGRGEYFVPILITYLTRHLYGKIRVEIELRKKYFEVKQEMAGISMVDEFSKYAKLQRKCNSLENQLNQIDKWRLYERKKAKLMMTYGFYIINGILVMILLYMYNNESVVELPKDSLWPINYFLSWPTTREDSISLIMWFMIMRTALFKC